MLMSQLSTRLNDVVKWNWRNNEVFVLIGLYGVGCFLWQMFMVPLSTIPFAESFRECDLKQSKTLFSQTSSSKHQKLCQRFPNSLFIINSFRVRWAEWMSSERWMHSFKLLAIPGKRKNSEWMRRRSFQVSRFCREMLPASEMQMLKRVLLIIM